MKKLTRTLRTSLILTAGASVVACAPFLESMSARQPKPQARAVRADLRPSIGYYENAVAAINDRHYALALEYLQAARAQKPDDVRVLTAFGVVYDKLGRFDLSARYYAQATTLDPKSRIVAADMDYSRKLQGISSASPPATVAKAEPDGAQKTQIAQVPRNTVVTIADNPEGEREPSAPNKTATSEVRPAANIDIPATQNPSVVATAGTEQQVTLDKATTSDVDPATNAAILAAPKAALAQVRSAAKADAPAPLKPVATATEVERRRTAPDKIAAAEVLPVTEIDAPAAVKPSLVAAGVEQVTPDKAVFFEGRPAAKADAAASPKPVAIAIERRPVSRGNAATVETRSVAQVVSSAQKPTMVNVAEAGHKPVTLNKSALVEARPVPKAGMLAAPKPTVNVVGAGGRLLAMIKLALIEFRAVTKMDAPVASKPSMVRTAGVERKQTALDKVALTQAATKTVPAAPKPPAMNAVEVGHEPVTLARGVPVEVQPAAAPAATKTVFLTGHALSIVNASGGSQVEKSVRAYLSRKGWSVAKDDNRRLPARTETAIVYRGTMVEAAKALARTLSLPVRLNADDNVQGLQLVLGTDLSGKAGRTLRREVTLAAAEPKVKE